MPGGKDPSLTFWTTAVALVVITFLPIYPGLRGEWWPVLVAYVYAASKGKLLLGVLVGTGHVLFAWGVGAATAYGIRRLRGVHAQEIAEEQPVPEGAAEVPPDSRY